MNLDNIILELAVIFAGTAVLSTLFLYLKQPVILSYIALGVLLGPYGFKVISNADHIEQLSHFGIILLLFLLGLHLQPKKLVNLFKKTSLLTIVTSLVFILTSVIITTISGFSIVEGLICGGALMFSSTVISLKLIPTTTLHHKRKGEMMTSVLLFQDILAIIMILLIAGEQGANPFIQVPLLLAKVTSITLGAFVLVRISILPLFRKFDVIQEYIFLVSLGWCLVLAEGAKLAGLSYEMGAFIAGISIASSPIAWVIAEKLKPLREFFLILFFFSVGAQFDYLVQINVLITGLILAAAILLVKPLAFKLAFAKTGEDQSSAKELGYRLGQASEFSLLFAVSAATAGKITSEMSNLIQLVTIITFIVSTYLVVRWYPTPISSSSATRAD